MYWQDAIELEIKTLLDLDVFEFKEQGFDKKTLKDAGYQSTQIHMVFDVKHDLRRKSRLVAGGHLVKLLNNLVYSSTVKTICVRLLHVIADKAGLTQLCGDIGNAFPHAETKEKILFIAGPEFGDEYEGMVVIVLKALHGLQTSSERWHAYFADTLRKLGFKPTRYDNDVWIHKHKGGTTYEYLCTHVDDFMIVSKDPTLIMTDLQSLYTVKSIGKPKYYFR